MCKLKACFVSRSLAAVDQPQLGKTRRLNGKRRQPRKSLNVAETRQTRRFLSKHSTLKRRFFDSPWFPSWFHVHPEFTFPKKKVSTWNPKQPFINGCFNWMIPNLYIGNGCFWDKPAKSWVPIPALENARFQSWACGLGPAWRWGLHCASEMNGDMWSQDRGNHTARSMECWNTRMTPRFSPPKPWGHRKLSYNIVITNVKITLISLFEFIFLVTCRGHGGDSKRGWLSSSRRKS